MNPEIIEEILMKTNGVISWLFSIFGGPKIANNDVECFKCKRNNEKVQILDLGDGDFICDECWNSCTPTVV